MARSIFTILTIVAVFLSLPSRSLAGSVVTYHGRILTPSGQAVESPNVTFKIQVRSPGAANCLLFEETRTIDMRNSDGIFVIPIGDGSGVRTANDPGIMIETVFSNNMSADHTGLACNSDGHYQPQAQDSRKLLLSFNDGTGAGDQSLPPMDINYVPFALHAREAQSALKVGALPAAQVMSVASGAATPLSAGHFAELLALVGGTSASYVRSSSLPSCASGEVLKATNGVFACVSDATGTDTLAGITCADGKILKRIAGAWACADESGVGTESDPTVQAYAKVAPGTGLKVSSGAIAADFGTVAGKVVEGNDARLSDSRAPSGAANGDLNGSYPYPTVKAIRGNAVNASAPADGQVYKWVTGSSEFQPKYVGVTDLRKGDGTPQMPATCAANETLSWSSVSDTLSCAAIGALDGSKITTGTVAYARLPVGAAANTVAAGDDARLTNARAPTGAAGGELGGTYPNPTVAKLAGVSINVSSLASGQILKYDGTNWVNSADSGVGAETDPSVQAYAKVAPGAGLTVSGGAIVPDFGTGAGKVVQGNDSRLSDNRVASDINGVAATGLIQRTGAGSYTALGTAAPVSVSGGNIGLAVGSGLTLSSGSLVPDFGSASGKVAQGNDSRFPSSTCASGNKMRWDGAAWQCELDNATDTSKVAKSGDTMTGALALPSNGLSVGTSQLVVSGGKVGVGVASPASLLQVSGASGVAVGAALTGDNAYTPPAASILFSGTVQAGPSIYSSPGNSTVLGLINNYSDNAAGGYARYLDIVALGSTGGAASNIRLMTGAATADERVRITGTGNVGIGTTSPGQKLSVAGTIESTSGGIRFPDGTTQTTAFTGGGGIASKTSAQRDAMSPVEGTVIYNSTLKRLEFYNGTQWMTQGTPISVHTFTSSDSLASGLVRYWSLNETGATAADPVGANDITMNGSPTSASGGPLGSDGARCFNGISQYGTFAAGGMTAAYAPSDPVTISFWYKGTDNGAGLGQSPVFGWNSGAIYSQFEITNGKFTFHHHSGGWFSKSSTTSINSNSWFHVVYVRRSDGYIDIYVNGSKEVDNVGAAIGSGNGYYVSALMYGYNGGYTEGCMDELGVWNRALTSTDVTALYNSGRGLVYRK